MKKFYFILSAIAYGVVTYGWFLDKVTTETYLPIALGVIGGSIWLGRNSN